jgi:hypothetical protein
VIGGVFLSYEKMAQDLSNSLWQLDDSIAQLKAERFSTTVDLNRPNLGLNDIVVNGTLLSGCVPLQITPEPPAPKSGESLVDWYVRGHDLVATYAQRPPRTVQPTYYWRSLQASRDVLGVELMVSMQTSLLDSDATFRSLSECRGDAHWLSEANKATPITATDWESPVDSRGFFLFRLARETSYVEMVFPSDFLGAEVTTSNGLSQLRYRMFPEELEKGVIRRGRIRALFLPSADDVNLAWEAYAQLCAEQPPLTT